MPAVSGLLFLLPEPEAARLLGFVPRFPALTALSLDFLVRGGKRLLGFRADAGFKRLCRLTLPALWALRRRAENRALHRRRKPQRRPQRGQPLIHFAVARLRAENMARGGARRIRTTGRIVFFFPKRYAQYSAKRGALQTRRPFMNEP